MTLATRWPVAVALACVVGACEPTVPNITVRTPGAIAPAHDAVSIVVIQPETRLHAVGLLDGRGQLVGQLDDRSHTLVRVSEGPTILYAVLGKHPETSDRIEGTLVSGRVYYATVSERPGGVALLTLNPRSPGGRWSHKDEYLRATPRVQMDPQLVTRAVNELGDPEAIIHAGNAYVDSLDAAARGEHQIQETDGN